MHYENLLIKHLSNRVIKIRFLDNYKFKYSLSLRKKFTLDVVEEADLCLQKGSFRRSNPDSVIHLDPTNPFSRTMCIEEVARIIDKVYLGIFVYCCDYFFFLDQSNIKNNEFLFHWYSFSYGMVLRLSSSLSLITLKLLTLKL